MKEKEEGKFVGSVSISSELFQIHELVFGDTRRYNKK